MIGTGDGASGGRTTNAAGMVIRCGEQEAQTTRPHFLELVSGGMRARAGGDAPAVVAPVEPREECVADGARFGGGIRLPFGELELCGCGEVRVGAVSAVRRCGRKWRLRWRVVGEWAGAERIGGRGVVRVVAIRKREAMSGFGGGGGVSRRRAVGHGLFGGESGGRRRIALDAKCKGVRERRVYYWLAYVYVLLRLVCLVYRVDVVAPCCCWWLPKLSGAVPI